MAERRPCRGTTPHPRAGVGQRAVEGQRLARGARPGLAPAHPEGVEAQDRRRGRVIPPMRRDGKKIDKGTPGRYLRAALTQLGLERDGLGWYETTRHTFASQWVLAGNS